MMPVMGPAGSSVAGDALHEDPVPLDGLPVQAPLVTGEPVPSRLAIPPARASVVPRERLLRRLKGTGAARLLTVTAPAGYGKTTLITQWSKVDPRPFRWLQLEPNDDDPVRLTRDLGFSLSAPDPIDTSLLASLGGGVGALVPIVLPRLARVLRELPPFVLVLDNAEVLHDEGACDVLITLVANLPERSTLVLMGRSQPPLPLGRMRASGFVDALDAADLAFTPGESQELLGTMSCTLSPEQERAVIARCEGWAAALYLASLTSSGRQQSEMVSGRDLVLREYLEEEVLACAPPADLDFLLRTSILDQMSGALCDAVLERHDSDRVLRRLASSELLVERLDRAGVNYRMHGLFADALRATLEREQPEEAMGLHRRAAAWFSQHEQFPEAMAHFLAADEVDAAAEILWRLAPQYLGTGRSGELVHLIQRFDDHALARHPELEAVLAWAVMNAGDGTQSRLLGLRAAAADDRVLCDGARLSAVIAALRAVIGQDGVRGMSEYASLACASLPPDNPFRTPAMLVRGAAAHLSGDRDAAFADFAAAERLAGGVVPSVQTLCLAQLALLEIERDNWAAATTLTRRARDLQRVHKIEHFAGQGTAMAISSLLAARRGDGPEARSEALLARRLLAHQRELAPWLEAEALIVLARSAVVLGDTAMALGYLADATTAAAQLPDAPVLHTYLEDTWALARDTEPTMPAGATPLTTSELRVLQYLPSHLALKEIAQRCFVSPNTVKTQVQSVYRKLGVSSRAAAVETGQRLGLLEP